MTPAEPGRPGRPSLAARSRRVVAALLVGVLGAVLLGACSGSSGIGGSGGNQGFVSGDGTFTTLDAADRRTPGVVAGTTLSGSKVSLADYRGKVVVINVWGSWCPPCRAEAPTLAKAARALAGKDVVFLGINSRNTEQDGPRAFQRRFHIPYPSIYDPDGRNLLAFHGTLPPNSIPSTIVIDRQGRVAASVIGSVSSASTLEGIVEDVAGGGTDG